ncbi:MAG: hypothetical protein R3E14_06180 [Erythrobacter sp.]
MTRSWFASGGRASENEIVIAQAVAALAGERTVLVIGHRGTLVDAAALRFHLCDGRLSEG